MATLAEMLRQGADRLINLPSEAQRFITNPQAFTQLVTGKNPLPRETGFAAGATGLPAQEMSVLDPNQAPYMQGYSQGEPIGYAGMAAPFAAPAAVATAKALAPKAGMMAENYMVRQGMIQPLTAYHGTPHTIQGQFDINKVGTGEGAQAYGHGMYFAENPEVAKSYRKPIVDANALNANSGKSFNSLQDFFDDVAVDKGNLYKVDIPDADIPNMLDWDKPLSEQSKEVQKVLKSINPNISNTDVGRVIYESFAKPSKMPENSPMWQFLKENPNLNPQQAASKYMTEQGITGIRYLDEGSRDAGKGTSNFVVFDPSTVKILEQNNKPVTRKELIQEQIDKIE
jgi:hypothetical protein